MTATPLQQIRRALRSGDDVTAIELLQSDPTQLTAQTAFGTCLHVAASFGRLEVVKYLVRSGADVNAVGGVLGGTALNEAASRGQLSVVEFLLSVGARMETREPEVNPLFGAIYKGHAAIVRLLLARGIDASISYTGQRMRNMDAVAFARERGQLAIADLIAAHCDAEFGRGLRLDE
jgi:ankyrin repeat protein